MAKLRPQVLSLCVVGLAGLAAACEGTGDVTTPPPGGSGGSGVPLGGNGGTGQPMMPGPIVGPQACQIKLTELALYQAVKVPLYRQGAAATTFNAPVIEGKRTLFRGYITLGGGAPGVVRGTLQLHTGGTTRSFPVDLMAEVDSTEPQLGSTINWDVPGEEMRGDTSVSVQLDLGDSCPGGGRTVHPASGGIALATRSTGILKLVLVPVRYDADQSGRLPDVTEAQLQRYRDIMMAYFPTREVDLTVRATVATAISLTASGGWGSFLDSLRALRAQDGAASDEYYYGLVSPAVDFRNYCKGTCTAGLSYLAQTANSSAQQVGAGVGFTGALAGETLVHEIGHQHGRAHTACGGGAGVDPRFPYAEGGIGVWGFDFRNMRLRAPDGAASSSHKDFMGYCNPQWVSDYTFSALATRRAAVSGTAASMVQGPAVATATRPLVGLTAGPARQTLLLGAGDGGPSTARWGGPVDGTEAPAGRPVAARALDASGATIDRLTVYRTDYGHGEGASLELPAARPGWAALELDDPTGPTTTIRLGSVAAALPALAPAELGIEVGDADRTFR